MNGYIVYESKGPYVGIRHCLFNLKALILEAAYLDRIPVVRPLRMHPKHNFGIKLNTQWAKYWDLHKTEVYYRNNEKYELMQKPFSFILEEDFKDLKFGDNQVYRLNYQQEITEADNNKYDLIIRSLRGIYRGWWLDAVPDKIQKNIRISFKVSDDVARISREIIQLLGWYAAVHVRRGDMLRRNKCLNKFTSPKHIYRTLREIVPFESNVYILTNERDRNFFDYLKKHYRIYQYFNFNELVEIVSGHEPDNYFLFMVELNIFENAEKKIGTFKSRSYFLEWDEVFPLSKYTTVDFKLSFRLKRYFRKKRSSFWKFLDRFKPIFFIV